MAGPETGTGNAGEIWSARGWIGSLYGLAGTLRRQGFTGLLLLLVAAFLLFAALPDLFAPHSPTAISLTERLRPPFWMDGGSSTNVLGTDHLGRDVLSRIIYGARVSLIVAAISLVISASIGLLVALVAGYFGGAVDAFLMRVVDSFLAFPLILLALILAAAFGPGLTNVVIVISALLWARHARILRGEVLTLMKRGFVAQAKVVGCSPLRIMVRHLIPNIAGTLIVLITLEVGHVIVIEASLSFLGAGIPPPNSSWGLMTSQGRDYLASEWWLATFPGLAIVLVVLSFNLLGDRLRDFLDPKLKQL